MSASDEIVWNIINQQFCSFKTKTASSNFCREPHNVTGLCNRSSCPLANSRYATVRMDTATGRIYLYMKTIERAHTPAKLWQRIKLSENYTTALKQIDDNLAYWPGFLIHKAKQRLTRLVQIKVRSRRIAAEESRLGEKLVPKLAPKVRRREATRERKAEAAAKLERTIERELLQRLRSGAYGDQPLNVNDTIWKKVLDGMEREGEGQLDEDLDQESLSGEENEDEQEKEMEAEEDYQDGHVEYVSDFDESENDLDDMEDWLQSEDESDEDSEESEDEEEKKEIKTAQTKVGEKRKRARVIQAKRKKPAREMEREMEYEQPNAQHAELAF
ncbi:ribosomal L28e protein family-domain-containing protein [Xylariomycetidae sp. FL2044]|nr:ribosomal L28e protein family-domain-containing protein [Xylariomycetidae sp. FL2044]